MHITLLTEAKRRYHPQSAEGRQAVSHLIAEAQSALDEGPFSVMDKSATPPSGDKHDFMSMGPYWWPDPDQADGLPYIRRDGQTNPQSLGPGSDSPAMSRMAKAVETLALCFFFTGQKPYAKHAAHLLRTWFLAPETQMHPHLTFGQAIPGRTEGRGIGIIDTVVLLKVIDAAELLRGTDCWTPATHEALRTWFGAYCQWLCSSSHGMDESRAPNNHGAWYDAQVAAFASFAGDPQTARRTLQTVGPGRLTSHIAPDGSQPRELARSLSFLYSCYNLEALFGLGWLGERFGVDLWHFQVHGRDAIRAALDYLAPFAVADKAWPHPSIEAIKRRRLLPLLCQGYLVYGEKNYLTLMRAFGESVLKTDRNLLIWPV